MRTKHLDDGWIAIMDGKREVIRLKPPEGGFSLADLRALRRHLEAGIVGPN